MPSSESRASTSITSGSVLASGAGTAGGDRWTPLPPDSSFRRVSMSSPSAAARAHATSSSDGGRTSCFALPLPLSRESEPLGAEAGEDCSPRGAWCGSAGSGVGRGPGAPKKESSLDWPDEESLAFFFWRLGDADREANERLGMVRRGLEKLRRVQRGARVRNGAEPGDQDSEWHMSGGRVRVLGGRRDGLGAGARGVAATGNEQLGTGDWVGRAEHDRSLGRLERVRP